MEAATQTRYRWTLRPIEDEAVVGLLGAELNNIPEPLARVLVLRGIRTFDEAEQFFRGGLDELHDPFLMKDMDRAAERLVLAVNKGERVLVYGDYDVDGTTSTALMVLFLRSLGVDATFFIPNRFVHGYGLSEAGIDVAVEREAGLIVALDCGITAIEEAAYAKAKGLDLIICDHHTAGDTLPDATAVLDPKRPDCPYPFKGLSGCGVGFKLVQATLQKLGLPPEDAWPYLDLVAVSTASDIVPLCDENRILMREGLAQMCRAPRLGLVALAERAAVDLDACTSSKIVFNLGPRINAAGRLAEASLAVDLLISNDATEAGRLADEIEVLNMKRRDLDMLTRDHAMAMAEEFMASDPLALVLHHPDWHAGVIGITASRVAEQFHRPAVLLTTDSNGEARGSARSIKGVSIYDALAACSDLLTRFGGHDFAAGLALPIENIPLLRDRLQSAIADVVDEDMLTPAIELDAHLELSAIDDRFWRILNQFSPFGPDNPRPTFFGRDLKVLGQPAAVGPDKRHLKLRVAQQKGSPSYSVIGFGLGDQLDIALQSVRRGVPIELAFTVEENTWNGRTSLQLRAKDIRLEDA